MYGQVCDILKPVLFRPQLERRAQTWALVFYTDEDPQEEALRE